MIDEEKPPIKATKPAWLKRKLLWPLKSKIFRTLPMKVNLLFVTLSRCFFWVWGLPPTGRTLALTLTA